MSEDEYDALTEEEKAEVDRKHLEQKKERRKRELERQEREKKERELQALMEEKRLEEERLVIPKLFSLTWKTNLIAWPGTSLDLISNSPHYLLCISL